MTISEPQPIPVGREPPPLQSSSMGNGQTPARRQSQGKAKGKHPNRKAGDRFAVLNAFVDAGMVGLSRVELATWFVLYRDTRDGTACTSIENIAARVGCSRRAVTNAIGRLRGRGLLVQVFKGGINRGPSRYRVKSTPIPPDS